MEARRKLGRLSLRLDEELLEGMKTYAFKRRTSVTVLVERFFVRLIEEDKKQPPVEADQI